MTVSTPAAPQRKFDQIVSADVKIQKICNSDHEYKITFVGNVSKVLMYQTWSSTSTALNNDRKVFEIGAKEWVGVFFRKVENGNVPSKDCKPYVTFTPTCVMELEHDECPIHDHKNEKCRHVFVINNAKVNGNGRIVFYVSSENIDPGNKNKVINKIKKIPKGEFHNARFDIDGVVSPLAQFISISKPNNGTMPVIGFIFPYSNQQKNVYELNFSNFGDNDNVQTGPIYFFGNIGSVITLYTFPMKFTSQQDANNMFNTIYNTLNSTISDSSLLTYSPGCLLTIFGEFIL